MSSSTSIRHVFLTGPPGVGKTTVIQKVSKELQCRNIPTKGFYTSELREGGRRVGFDVVALDGTRSSLARIGESAGPRVGQYVVQVHAFESIALPILQSKMNGIVTIIDEVGKMELFSQGFEQAVKNGFSMNSIILGTIPVKKGKPIHLIEFIRTHPSVKLITVDLRNRDNVTSEIVNILASIFKEHGGNK